MSTELRQDNEMEEKGDEDATSKHCNKKEKPQTSSLLLLLLLQLPLPKK